MTFRRKRGKAYKSYVSNGTETRDPVNDFQLIVKVQIESMERSGVRYKIQGISPHLCTAFSKPASSSQSGRRHSRPDFACPAYAPTRTSLALRQAPPTGYHRPQGHSVFARRPTWRHRPGTDHAIFLFWPRPASSGHWLDRQTQGIAGRGEPW